MRRDGAGHEYDRGNRFDMTARGFAFKKGLTGSHWGTYRAVEDGDGRMTLRAFEEDPDPSAVGFDMLDVCGGPLRIGEPVVRRIWLDHGPGAAPERRGREAFVAVSWDRAEELVAAEVDRVRKTHGNPAIFGGSYGWASAGRFHHAQSQLKRFLNCAGGFTYSVDTYSFAAAEVMIPHVLGNYLTHLHNCTAWSHIVAETELFVAFGGIPLKNGQITSGGTGRHIQRDSIRAAS